MTTAMFSRLIEPPDHWIIIGIESQLTKYPLTIDDMRIFHKSDDSCGFVYGYTDSDSVGYVMWRLVKQSYYLDRIGVVPEFKRHGIGRLMMDGLKARLNRKRGDRLHTVVPEKSMITLYFLRACGFKAKFLIRGGGFDLGEDGIEMEFTSNS